MPITSKRGQLPLQKQDYLLRFSEEPFYATLTVSNVLLPTFDSILLLSPSSPASLLAVVPVLSSFHVTLAERPPLAPHTSKAGTEPSTGNSQPFLSPYYHSLKNLFSTTASI